MSTNQENDGHRPSQAAGPPATGTSITRRRFGKAGLAAPVMMTLASRPVWGTNQLCSLSGDIFSGNISDHDHRDCTEGFGCTPGFWKNNTDAWPPTGFSPGQCLERDEILGTCTLWDAFGEGTPFADVFGFTPLCAPGYATLMEVLQTCNGHLDWHATAAALNAAHPSIPFGASLAQVVAAYTKARNFEVDNEVLKDVFDNMNNRGCPLNAHGDCDDRFTRNEAGECIPVRTSEDVTP